jgi:hypothetical protein
LSKRSKSRRERLKKPASRAAAREYGVYGHEAGALDRARQQAESILLAGGLSVDYEIVIQDHGSHVEVHVLYRQPFPGSRLIALVGAGDGDPGQIPDKNIRGYALYRREQNGGE